MNLLLRRLIAVSIPACVVLSSPTVHSADTSPVREPEAGVTIMGDRDSALGLFLAPWKEEERADLGRPPGLQDPGLAPVDPDGFGRTTTYYQTGRAYRAERLQRNR